MVAKIVILATLLALSYGCGCQQDMLAESLHTGPADALNFFKGFIAGVELNACANSTCFYNATYFIGQA
jgi:hypothetical protein